MLDLSNMQFGNLTVIKRADKTYNGNYKWWCFCQCGAVKAILGDSLKSGKTQSCGCFQREITSKTNSKHKLRHSRLYSIWCGMKQRCLYLNHTGWSRYGGRGITICEEWLNDFKAFYDWAMSHGYQDNLTIDRINNDGNYEPSNCQWLTVSENTKKAWVDKRLGDFGVILQ